MMFTKIAMEVILFTAPVSTYKVFHNLLDWHEYGKGCENVAKKAAHHHVMVMCPL